MFCFFPIILPNHIQLNFLLLLPLSLFPLRLVENSVGPEGASALATALTSNRTLQTLGRVMVIALGCLFYSLFFPILPHPPSFLILSLLSPLFLLLLFSLACPAI